MNEKFIKVDDLTEVARDYNEKINVNILEALGIKQRLIELVGQDTDVVTNLNVLAAELNTIKTTLTGYDISVTNCRVIDLNTYITELGDKVAQLNREKSELQAQITNAEEQLEVLV